MTDKFSVVLRQIRIKWRVAIPSLFSLVTHPSQEYWRGYFKQGRRKVWTDKRFTGWKEMPDGFQCAAQMVATGDDGELFYVATVIDMESMGHEGASLAGVERVKVEELEFSLDRYLHPDCRCRLRYHFLCPLHSTWGWKG